MTIPKNIRKEDVVNAIEEANQAPWPSSRNARKHELLYKGRSYPVKYIISLASKYAGNGELPSSEFISTESRARLQRLGFKIISQPTMKSTGQVVSTEMDIPQDITEIEADKTIDLTTRQALIEARIGQGKFRRGVMGRWNNTCAFSGCMTAAVLRASHIKPWRECSNEERLDPTNGLLLAANIDALFDRGLISFEDDGHILLSSVLSEGERELLHLSEGRLRGDIDARMSGYLAHHRKKFVG